MADLRLQVHRDDPGPPRADQRHLPRGRRRPLHGLRRRHRPGVAAKLLQRGPPPLPHGHPPDQVLPGQDPGPDTRRRRPLRRLHRRLRPLLAQGLVLRPAPVRRRAAGPHARGNVHGQRGAVRGERVGGLDEPGLGPGGRRVPRLRGGAAGPPGPDQVRRGVRQPRRGRGRGGGMHRVHRELGRRAQGVAGQERRRRRRRC